MPSLTSDLQGNAGSNHHPGYFRTIGNDLHQAQAVAGFVYHKLGLRRMPTIHDGDPYTGGLTSAFARSFVALGGRITATAQVRKGDVDMSATPTRPSKTSPGCRSSTATGPERTARRQPERRGGTGGGRIRRKKEGMTIPAKQQ